MKEALQGLEKQLPSRQTAQASVDLLCKLLQNVIENPQEPKFRTVKRENKRVKQLLTGFKQGERLMTLCGFSLVDTHSEFPELKLPKAEHSYRLAPGLETSYLKGVKLELQGAFSQL